MELTRFVEDLEKRIDIEVEERIFADWRQFCMGRYSADVFSPKRIRKGAPAANSWPTVSVNQALACPEKMLLQQLAGCSATLTSQAGRLMTVRANYGVVNLAMPFGCELFTMDDSANTLPNCHPLGAERAREWADRGMPDVDHPYLRQIYDFGRRVMEIKRDYPKIGKYVYVYHPDLQGPMDILELIWGSEIFLYLVDEPELVHRMLRIITDFYIAVMRRWQSIVPAFDAEVSCHWGYMQPGQIMIRDDSAMNLPPEMFDEFIRPYDQELLDGFGGGAIHACGRVDHWAKFLCDMPGAHSLQMSQPELNKMPSVISDTVDRGISLLDLRADAVEQLRSGGRPLRGRVQTFL